MIWHFSKKYGVSLDKNFSHRVHWTGVTTADLIKEKVSQYA